jgi:hypothetical protein
MSSLLPSIVALGPIALAALWLATRRTPAADLAAARESASISLAVATAVQAAHFGEEWATGFHQRFPALFGLEPMPVAAFVTFNVAWIVIWTLSIPLLRGARTAAFVAAWFLALAGMLNGVAHPLLAVMSGGYFPGLVTSPLIGLACIGLWRRLRGATSAAASDRRD